MSGYQRQIISGPSWSATLMTAKSIIALVFGFNDPDNEHCKNSGSYQHMRPRSQEQREWVVSRLT